MPTRRTSSVVLNLHRRSVSWPDGPLGGKCIWELHDVWGWDKIRNEGIVLRENYFRNNPAMGKKIDWYTDLKKWTEREHGVSAAEKIIFTEAIPNEVRFITFDWFLSFVSYPYAL
ncbi:hypothetical protein C0995_012353 [Termitomyces sp. Mi166|nr:hypothetical protein C0995_012353 [Termitomyces sp. Mi166\